MGIGPGLAKSQNAVSSTEISDFGDWSWSQNVFCWWISLGVAGETMLRGAGRIIKIRSCIARTDLKINAFSADFCL